MLNALIIFEIKKAIDRNISSSAHSLTLRCLKSFTNKQISKKIECKVAILIFFDLIASLRYTASLLFLYFLLIYYFLLSAFCKKETINDKVLKFFTSRFLEFLKFVFKSRNKLASYIYLTI